jgi:hypothetical protein
MEMRRVTPLPHGTGSHRGKTADDLIKLLEHARDERLRASEEEAERAAEHVHNAHLADHLKQTAARLHDPQLAAVAQRIEREEEAQAGEQLIQADEDAEQAEAYAQELTRVRTLDQVAHRLRAQSKAELQEYAGVVSAILAPLQQLKPAELRKVPAGEQIRDHTVALGTALQRDVPNLANPAMTLDDARRIVEEMVAFIAGVLTIGDHVQGLIEILQRGAELFEQLVPLLPAAVAWPFALA